MLQACADSGICETVLIRRSGVPRVLESATVVYPDCAWDGTRLLVTIDGVARYLVTGDVIDVEPLDGSNAGDVRAFLLGTVFGTLCHLRGILPLHASAIAVRDGSIAFAGNSGDGKSTMAAALNRHGYPIVADDVTCFRSGSGPIAIWPGVTRLRLWQSAMDGLGYASAGVERELRGYDKFLVPAGSVPDPHLSLPLRAIYCLEWAREGSSVGIERVRGAAALGLVLENVYRHELAERIGLEPFIFGCCARIASQVPVYRLIRPMDYRSLAGVLEAFESSMREESVSF
jgi:hypothetical protein